MNVSIRRRLIVNLLVTIAFVAGITLVMSYNDAKHEVQELFDAQLAQSARVLQAMILPELLIGPNENLQQLLLRFPEFPPGMDMESEEAMALGHEYERKLSFQVWDREKNMILRSATAPTTAISVKGLDIENRGFVDEVVGNYDWRVFSLWDDTETYLIQVGERYDVRDELITKISRRLITPSLISLPFLGLMIWVGIGRGMKPVQKVTDEVTRRDPAYLEPMDIGPVPSEIRPLVKSLNELFGHVKYALEKERQFTDDAAHELRTPLAALKTQAQVALRASQDEERRSALQHVINSVDRATHMVEQMLTLARLDPESNSLQFQEININELAAEVVAQLAPAALKKDITIELLGDETVIKKVEPISFSILVRNLVDNAIRYTDFGGEVIVNIEKFPGARSILSVADTGPGIDKDLIDRVFDRFFRVVGSDAQGCGLGLSIVKRIADLNGLDVELKNKKHGKGLIASVYID